MNWRDVSRWRRHSEWMAYLRRHHYPIKVMQDNMRQIATQKRGEEAIKGEMEARLSKAKAKV